MSIRVSYILLFSAACLGVAIFGNESRAGDDESFKPYFHSHVYSPPHISAEWQQFYDSFRPFWDVPDPHNMDDWKAWDAAKQKMFVQRDTVLLDKYGVTLRELTIGDVRVVEITPRELRFSNKSLMYMHGGAWASYSPESTWIDTVPLADKLGIRIYAVDYVKAPMASLYDIIDQNVAVFEHLVTQLEYKAKDVGVYGCSAGGHLSLAVPNALRNRGIGVPGAAVARSPMIDFTMTNDTWITLEGQDPLVAREAYVRKLMPILGIEDFRDPIVSPHLDDNLADGMPPTLLQTGGKEILLSDSLVMFQALEAAGQVTKLDLYDGMPHCFAMILPETREARVADTKQVEWFRKHLSLR